MANRQRSSHDGDKRRVIEHSAHELMNKSTTSVRPRCATPAGRTLTTFRKNSIKIFSLFRGTKSGSFATEKRRHSLRSRAQVLSQAQ